MISLNEEVSWGDLVTADITTALSVLECECRKEHVSEVILMRAVLEWRLYVLHKIAATSRAQRKRKAAGMECVSTFQAAKS